MASHIVDDVTKQRARICLVSLFDRPYVDQLAVMVGWVQHNLPGTLSKSYMALVDTMAVKAVLTSTTRASIAWHSRYESQMRKLVNTVAHRGLTDSLISYVDAIPSGVDSAMGDQGEFTLLRVTSDPH